jgi:hypothetical protein
MLLQKTTPSCAKSRSTIKTLERDVFFVKKNFSVSVLVHFYNHLYFMQLFYYTAL